MRSLLDMTPFGSRDANVYSMVLSLETEHAARLARYRKAWRFYGGAHWDYQQDADSPNVTINFARKFVNRHVSFLMKKAFKVTVPDNPATPNKEDEDREFVRAMLTETWRRNKIGLFCLEAGQMGSVTGDVFIRVSWDDDDPLEDPYARADVIPSRYVFPSYGGASGMDSKRMTSCLIFFPVLTDGTQPDSLKSLTKSQRKKLSMRAEHWFIDRVDFYDGDEKVASNENPFGEIPIVHICNRLVAGNTFGLGDLADVIELQKEFNERTTDVSDVVNYQGSPITWIKGAKVEQLDRGANRVWGLPEGAEIGNLALGGELGASMSYLETLKKTLHEMGDLPLGILDSTLKAESGVGMSLSFMPMLEVREEKMLTYGVGFRLVNRLLLKVTELKDPTFARELAALKGNRYRNDVTFPSPMPRDESLELERARMRLELGISSRRRELEMMGKSQSEIDKILEDALADRKQESELEFELGMSFDPPEKPEGNPNPKRPEPNVQGEKRSIAAQNREE